jgi:hypothetical protein
MLPKVDMREPREGVTIPKRTCTNREDGMQIVQTQVGTLQSVCDGGLGLRHMKQRRPGWIVQQKL